ncbi:hypothetical protein [Caballeronia sp. ATUFL_M2_KS44]|uniref:hypothetical protein n=1 Tax=Caballeronia sp. ATUFL_M2_KS44 TaxID=2921767 RepID=UPI002028775D|nr:hypothetical protein [Caballeronia sp. ATUFL_M2_KS44]
MGIKEFWHRVDGPIFGVVLLGACCGITYVVKDRIDSSASATWEKERAQYVKRFPEVRAEERASCTREYEAKLTGVQALSKQQADDVAAMKKQIDSTNELVAYTLRFLGDRAKVADQRNAAMLKQTKVAAAAAVDAKQTAEKVDQKVNVAVVKADEAASAVKSVDKKLDTATHGTAAVPPTPWAGNRR